MEALQLGRMTVKLTAGLVILAALTAAMSGCVSGSDSRVDYSGNYSAAANACGRMAMNGALRDDPGVPSVVGARDINAWSDGAKITVTGETYVGGGSTQVVYSWECLVVQSTKELNAEIVQFGPASDDK